MINKEFEQNLMSFWCFLSVVSCPMRAPTPRLAVDGNLRARRLGSVAMAMKSASGGVECDLGQRRKGKDHHAGNSLKANAKGFLSADPGVENEMKSSRNTKKSTGVTTTWNYSIMLMIWVIIGRGVRVDDRRDVGAWKQGM
jgi:hypothetical protein